MRRVKQALSLVDRFDNEEEPHGFITMPLDSAIKSYQKEKGLRVDGILKPGGKTEESLFKNVSDRIFKNINGLEQRKENFNTRRYDEVKSEQPKRLPKENCDSIEQEIQVSQGQIKIAGEKLYRNKEQLNPIKIKLKSKYMELENNKTELQTLKSELALLQNKILEQDKNKKEKAGKTGRVIGHVVGGALGIEGGFSSTIKGVIKGGQAGEGFGISVADIYDRLSASDLEKKAKENSQKIEFIEVDIQNLTQEIFQLESEVIVLQKEVDNSSDELQRIISRTRMLQSELKKCRI